MPRITVNGKAIEMPAGTTLLQAAHELGVDIPTLCHLDPYPPLTSCMICVVEDESTGRLLPACSARGEDGQRIRTDSPAVQEARRHALELLLSEHAGDCEAPCRRGCPCRMNVPRMIRQIRAGQLSEALSTIRRHIALPGVLGRICPAPCERACRRAQWDASVSICLLKRFAADQEVTDRSSSSPLRQQLASGHRIAVVGAGPTGLSAAFYLRVWGHDVTLFEAAPHAGGQLRNAVPPERLPREVLDREVATVLSAGIVWCPESRLGKDMSLEEIRRTFHAVLLAIGPIDGAEAGRMGLPSDDRGIQVDSRTMATTMRGVFAAGAATGACRLAVQACAAGRRAAATIHEFLLGVPPEREPHFHISLGRLSAEEWKEVMREAHAGPRIEPAGGLTTGFALHEAQEEAARCLHCDCRKRLGCRLRHYAEKYGAEPARYRGERMACTQRRVGAGLWYEPGKCIKCGLCVRIAEQNGETAGPTFVGRGFEVRVDAPWGTSLEGALRRTAEVSVRACPTGALAWEGEEESGR